MGSLLFVGLPLCLCWLFWWIDNCDRRGRLLAAWKTAVWGRRLIGCTVLAGASLAVLSAAGTREAWALAVAFTTMFFFNDATMGPAWAACHTSETVQSRAVLSAPAETTRLPSGR